MPNRYIREGIIESEAVNSLSWIAEVFYRRLHNRVDDFGRFTAHPALLRASIFPLQLDKVRQAEVPRLLTECEEAGLIYVYAVKSKQYLVLNKWEKGRADKSRYPEPPERPESGEGEVLASAGKFSGKDGGVGSLGSICPHNTSDPDPDPDPDPDNPPTPKPSASPPGFDELWKAYPKKVAKGAAMKVWVKLKLFPHLEAILLALFWQKKCDAWTKDGGQFIPHLATYLNAARWLDENTERKASKSLETRWLENSEGLTKKQFFEKHSAGIGA